MGEMRRIGRFLLIWACPPALAACATHFSWQSRDLIIDLVGRLMPLCTALLGFVYTNFNLVVPLVKTTPALANVASSPTLGQHLRSIFKTTLDLLALSLIGMVVLFIDYKLNSKLPGTIPSAPEYWLTLAILALTSWAFAGTMRCVHYTLQIVNIAHTQIPNTGTLAVSRVKDIAPDSAE